MDPVVPSWGCDEQSYEGSPTCLWCTCALVSPGCTLVDSVTQFSKVAVSTPTSQGRGCQPRGLVRMNAVLLMSVRVTLYWNSQKGDSGSQRYMQSLPVLIAVYPLINYFQNDKSQQLMNLTAAPFIVWNDVKPRSSWLPFTNCQAGNVESWHNNIFPILARILGVGAEAGVGEGVGPIYESGNGSLASSLQSPRFIHHPLSPNLPLFLQPLWDVQKLVPTFSGGSLCEWQVHLAGILILVSKSRPLACSSSPAAQQEGHPAHLRAWRFTWGANCWFISQSHMCHLEANSQSPGPKNPRAGTLCWNITRGCLCRLFFLVLSKSSYLYIPTFQYWAFFKSTFRNIFSLLSPLLGIAGPGSCGSPSHPPPRVLGSPRPTVLVLLQVKEGLILIPITEGHVCQVCSLLECKYWLENVRFRCVDPKCKDLIPLLKYRERRPPWHRAPFHRNEFITQILNLRIKFSFKYVRFPTSGKICLGKMSLGFHQTLGK